MQSWLHPCLILPPPHLPQNKIKSSSLSLNICFQIDIIYKYLGTPIHTYQLNNAIFSCSLKRFEAITILPNHEYRIKKDLDHNY